MANANIQNQKFIRAANAAAAAQTAIQGSIIDLAEHDHITAIAALGDVSAGSVLTLSLEFGDQPNLSDAVASSSTATFTAAAADADNKLLVLTHNHPHRRYCRAVLTRTTANAAVDGIVCIVGKQSRATATRPTDDAVAAAESYGSN